MKKMTILFTSFPDFSGNSKSLFIYMNNRYKENMNLIWVVEDEEVLNNLKNEGIKVVKWYSEEYWESLNNANVLFDTHGQFSNFNNNDKIYINLWHGMPIKKIGYLLEDEALNDIDIAFLDKVSSNTDFLFVTSPFYSSIISSVFNINVKKVLPLGMPRLDELLTSKNKEKFERLTSCKISDFNKILIYLPTYRNGCGKTNDGQLSSENVLNLKKYDEKRLIKYLEKNRYLLLVKYHPSENSNVSRIQSDHIVYLDDPTMSKYMITLNEILNFTDLLITDYSSIYIDYLILDKPVIFINTDLNSYLKNRGLIFDNPNFWYPGPKVENFAGFVRETEKLLNSNNYFSNERIKFKEIIITHKGNNCERICNFLFKNNKLSTKCLSVIKLKKAKQAEINYLQNLETKIEEQNIIINDLSERLNNIYKSKAYNIYKVVKKWKKAVFKK